MRKMVMLFLVFCLAGLLNVIACAPAEKPPAEQVKVGVIGHMGYFCGDYQWRGAVIAAEEINATGGVLGRPIELVKTHSNEMVSVPDAASAMEKLITVDKAVMVIGGFRSEAVLAMQDVACDYEVVFISSSAHYKMYERVAEDYDRYKYYFKPYPNAAYMGATMADVTATVADVVREQLGIETPKVAILAEKAMWAEAIAKVARATAPKIGVEIVGEWWPSATATDVTPELTAIKASGAHIMWNIIVGPVCAAVGKQWYELKIPAAWSGVNGLMWDAEGYLEATKADYSATWDPGGQARVEMTPKTIPIWDKYYEKWGSGPSFLAAGSYDALYIWKEAVERAGTFDSDAVVKELEKTDFTGMIGRIVFQSLEEKFPHCGKFGKAYMTYSAMQVIGGEVKNFWPVPEHPTEWAIEYKGTVPYQLPPWMVEYWKGR